MSIERIRIAGMLASLLFAAAPATGQDFNQRFAAWQGRAPMPQRTTSQPVMPSPAPEVGGESEAIPAPRTGNSNSQRILGDVYDAPCTRPTTTIPGPPARAPLARTDPHSSPTPINSAPVTTWAAVTAAIAAVTAAASVAVPAGPAVPVAVPAAAATGARFAPTRSSGLASKCSSGGGEVAIIHRS